MFFILSKIIWWLLSPLTLILLALAFGLFLSRIQKSQKFGKKLVKTGVFAFIILSILPIGYNIQVFLETDSPQAQISQLDIDEYEGVIVLGGCMDASLSRLYDQPHINGSCERLIQGLSIHNKHPQLKFVYTGGSGSVTNQKDKGATAAKQLVDSLGINSKDIIFEDQSRNTYENMKFSTQYKQTDKKWILITSASHMPRSSRVFCEGGWDITPYPTDYNTTGNFTFALESPLYNFNRLNTALKEIVGIIAYGVTGKLSMNACTEALI